MYLWHALAHVRDQDTEAQHRRVAWHQLARRTAKEAIDRLAEPTPLEIPQGAIDGADRQHRVTLPPVHHDAVHLVPQLLVRDRVLTEQYRAQALGHEDRHHLRHRAGDANHSGIGFNPDEVLDQAEVVGVELDTAFEIIALAIPG